MLQTKTRTGKRFDGSVGPVGLLFWTVTDETKEPTPHTLKWLLSIALQRATGDKILVGKYRGHWVEIEGNGEMLATYAVRQLPDDNPPLFFSEPTQGRNHYSADVHACTLRQHLTALFVFDPRGVGHDF